MWARFWLRLLGKAALALLAIALVAYPVDFAIWRIRLARGGGMGSVSTFQMVAAEEKGNKEEFFPTGEGETPCSQSMYPQGGNAPCWWLSRHIDQITRY